MKKQSFAKGAALLAVAIGLGKIFSAVFKIPLDRLFLHAEGMAVFNSAYNIYMLFFSVATAGIPMAISSLVAGARDKDEENAILSTSLISTEAFLVVSAFLIFVFSDTIASLTKMPEASLSIKIMAPALVFCGLTASFRGFFQGKRVMTPPALSQVSDSFGRLFLGFLLVSFFASAPLSHASAAAISGIPFGALLSALILIISFLKTKTEFHFVFSSSILKKILFLAMPITLTSSLHALFNVVDTMSVVPVLSNLSDNAQHAFGTLSRAATLYALPVSIAGAVSSSILPAVSENHKNGNYKAANYESQLALRLTILISIPCSAGFMAISSHILNLLYDDATNASALVFIAPAATLLSAGSILSSILQGMGKTKYTVFSALFALLAKAALNPVLMYFMGVNGAALSTTCAYLVFVISLVVYTYRLTPLRFSFSKVVLLPLLCAFLCFITAFLSSYALPTPLSILLAAVIYIPSIFLTGFISPKEFKQIFAG